MEGETREVRKVVDVLRTKCEMWKKKCKSLI